MKGALQRTKNRAVKRVAAFTGRHPLIGPLFWILSIQYFITQAIVAAAWVSPPYSWLHHVISDLGAVGCGVFHERLVCSPLHPFMNTSFVVFGLTMAFGAQLIYTEFRRTRLSLAGFSLMALAGVGTAMVGLFPEDVNWPLHAIGATLALLVGNVSIMVLAIAITEARRGFRIYTFVSGAFSSIAFILLISGIHLDLGAGGMERLVSYPFTIWLILFGIYMTVVRIRAHRSAK